MGAIYAELRVGGHVFPVLLCTYDVHQATDRRGRVITKVRFGRVRLVLNVPRTDFLKIWAADAHKRWAVDVVFRDGAGGSAVETVSLAGAYCVFYQEVFTRGDTHTGSYILNLELSDPDGFTMYAGGPASAFVVPAAREHGTPPVAAADGPRQKLPVIPLADGIGPAGWRGNQDLPSWTEAHKAARWAEYQREKIAKGKKGKPQDAWDKQYETNRNNNIFGLARERDYARGMNATSKMLKTKYTWRQIDMYKKDDSQTYCGQLKTGFIYLTKQAKIDLKKDAWLALRGRKVEYILEKGGSQPLLAAISAAGATYKIGPQIPY